MKARLYVTRTSDRARADENARLWAELRVVEIVFVVATGDDQLEPRGERRSIWPYTPFWSIVTSSPVFAIDQPPPRRADVVVPYWPPHVSRVPSSTGDCERVLQLAAEKRLYPGTPESARTESSLIVESAADFARSVQLIRLTRPRLT